MSAPAAGGLHRIDEEIADRELDVYGVIPHWLTGSYFLNGPGQFSVGNREVNHWFDILAMLHRVRVTDGDVIYTNRFLRSQELAHVREHGDLKHAQFYKNNDKSIVKRLRALVDPRLTDNGARGVFEIWNDGLASLRSFKPPS